MDRETKFYLFFTDRNNNYCRNLNIKTCSANYDPVHYNSCTLNILNNI